MYIHLKGICMKRMEIIYWKKSVYQLTWLRTRLYLLFREKKRLLLIYVLYYIWGISWGRIETFAVVWYYSTIEFYYLQVIASDVTVGKNLFNCFILRQLSGFLFCQQVELTNLSKLHHVSISLSFIRFFEKFCQLCFYSFYSCLGKYSWLLCMIWSSQNP